jgi:hypothetical protein
MKKIAPTASVCHFHQHIITTLQEDWNVLTRGKSPSSPLSARRRSEFDRIPKAELQASAAFNGSHRRQVQARLAPNLWALWGASSSFGEGEKQWEAGLERAER